MSENIKGKVFSGLFWTFGERICAQLVTFIVSTVLARLLEPSYYGAIAIVNIFIAIANVLAIGGFGNSLIQKKDADNVDFSSVFFFNIAWSTVLYIILYLGAPLISQFFDMEILTPVMRVLGFRIIIGGINNIQHAYVSKHMLFKRFFWSTLIGTIISGVVGIYLAYKGFGIWALVAQYMTNTATDTVVLWFTVKWRPEFKFSFKRLSSLFSYGWKLLVSSLLDTGYNQLRGLVIGRMYTATDLAFYEKGKSFPNLVVTNINTSIQNVLFPAMAAEQEKKDYIKAMMRRSIRVSSYVMLPLMAGLALVAKPLISLLLTDKWLDCVPYLQISCFVFAFMPIHTANLQAVKALGRSDIFLKLEVIKKIIGLLALIVSIRYGVLAIAMSSLLNTLISSVINAIPNKKLLNYGLLEQIMDMFGAFIPLLIMSISLICLNIVRLNLLPLLFLQVVVGIFVYILTSCIMKNETFFYILNNLLKFKK